LSHPVPCRGALVWLLLGSWKMRLH
jgi:hypothetical protein